MLASIVSPTVNRQELHHYRIGVHGREILKVVKLPLAQD
jgi:hypothetical protein